MATQPRSQIPLNRAIVDSKGMITVPWAFWFQSQNQGLPPIGSTYVIDGSAATVQTTQFQGSDALKGSFPSDGYIYIATDTGKTYVAQANQWVLQDPAYTGDVTKSAGSTVTTLANVFSAPGTYGSQTTVPILTIDGKGRVIGISLQNISIPLYAGGTQDQLQYNNGGLLAGTVGVTYDAPGSGLVITGNLIANLVSANTGNFGLINGTLTTANQPNITNVGTLTSLSVSGNVAFGSNLSISGNITSVDSVQFDTTATITSSPGKVFWDDADGTIAVGLKGGNVTLQIGEEQVVYAKNDSGVALTDGQLVCVNGSSGQRISVRLANAATESNSTDTLGMVTEAIPNNNTGFITTSGLVNRLNTNVDSEGNPTTEGDLLFLSATVAGGWTRVKPSPPAHGVRIGYLIKKSAGNGSIFIKVDNGYELDELHDVLISNATSGQALVYSTGNLWRNQLVNTVGTLSNISITGNATIGNVSTGLISGTLTTANQPNITSVGTLTNLSVSGNITGNYLIGNGAFLTNVTAAISNVAQTVSNAAQPNITSVGTLTSLSVSGNANIGNIGTSGRITATGNITGGNLIGNLITGTLTTANQPNVTSVGTLTGLTVNGIGSISSFVGTNDSSFFANLQIVGNATIGNISTAGRISATGNITGGNITGNLLTGTLSAASSVQPNIIVVGTLTSLAVFSTANIGGGLSVTGGDANIVNNLNVNKTANVGNLITPGFISATGNITGNLLTGTLTTANQPNITNVGTLSSLSVSGNINIGNVNATNGVFTNITGTLTTANQPNITNVGTLTNLSVTGNITSNTITANFGTIRASDSNGLTILNSAGNVLVGALVNNGDTALALSGNTTTQLAANGAVMLTVNKFGVNKSITMSGNTSMDENLSVTGNATVGNVSATNGVFTNITGTLTTANQPNITSVGTLTTLSVSGNANVGNIGATNGAFSNITGTIRTGSQPNITTIGILSTLSITGNANTGNINVSGNLSASGNVRGTYLLGDGSLISNISVSAGSQIINGNSNVSVAANGNITMSVAGVSNVVVVSNNSATITGNLAFTGDARRIIGDFSNTTLSNRTIFLTSTANSPTVIGVQPNGNSVLSGMVVFNTNNPDVAAQGLMYVNGNAGFVVGTDKSSSYGTQIPLLMVTAGVERGRIATDGTVNFGSTGANGDITTTATVNAGLFRTFTGQVTMANNTWVDLFTVPSLTYGTWLVSIGLNAADAPNYSTTSIVVAQTNSMTSAYMIKGTLTAIQTAATRKVQGLQASGASQTVFYTATRIA